MNWKYDAVSSYLVTTCQEEIERERARVKRKRKDVENSMKQVMKVLILARIKVDTKKKVGDPLHVVIQSNHLNSPS